MMVLPRLAGAGEASALESFGIEGEKKSPMAKMSEKFSELLETVTAIREKNVSLVDGFKKIFSRKGSEKTPQELREKAQQKDRFEKIYEVLVEIRDAMEGGGMGGGKGFLSKMKDMFGKGKSFMSGLLDNPLVAAIIGGSIVPIVSSLTGFLKAGIFKVFGSAAALAPFAKFLVITAIVADNIIDGIKGWFKSSEWGVDSWAGATGGILGGSGSGWANALYKGATFAYMGAKMGGRFGPKGALIGGIAGGIIGTISGFFGGEEVAKFLHDLFNKGILETLGDRLKILSMKITDGIESIIDSILSALGVDFNTNVKDDAQKLVDEQSKDGKISTVEQNQAILAAGESRQSLLANPAATGYNESRSNSSRAVNLRYGNEYKKSVFKGNPYLSEVINHKYQSVGDTSSFFKGDPLSSKANPLGIATGLSIAGYETSVDNMKTDQFNSNSASKNKRKPLSQEALTKLSSDLKLFEAKGGKNVEKAYKEKDQAGNLITDENGNQKYAIGFGFGALPTNMEILNKPMPEVLNLTESQFQFRDTKEGDTISNEQSEKLLQWNIRHYDNYLSEKYGSKFYNRLGEERKSALVQMIYQLGPSRFNNFKRMIASLEEIGNIHNSGGQSSAGYDKRLKNAFLISGVHAADSKWAKDQTSARAAKVVYQLIHGESKDGEIPTYEGQHADGFIAKKPSLIMTGEYDGAGENPEVTIQMNALENRVLATTNKIIEMKRNQEQKNPVFLNSALESKTINTINTSRSSEERVMMKENMERRVVQMQMPVVNSVVDNKTINNTNAPILIRKTSRNESNPFLVG
jgi:gas vesicle protein